jgi:hypothetical protein
MILINIKMQIRPEKMDEWLVLADSYAKDVNSEEGCLFFQFARSLTDDNEFVCIEGFKDAESPPACARLPWQSYARYGVSTRCMPGVPLTGGCQVDIPACDGVRAATTASPAHPREGWRRQRPLRSGRSR